GSLVRKSDPYAAYAAIYAPYFGTEKEEEAGRRGSMRRNRASGNGTSGGASVTGDNSISQLSHTFRERTGVALRDSVVLPGVLEMPPSSMSSRPASYASYSATVAAMPPRPPPSLPPPPRPISSSTRILPTPSIITATSSATTNNNNIAIIPPSSSSRAPPSSFNPKVLRMGEQEGNGNDADGGNRTGVKGKRTLSDKIKRGTLPLVPSLLEEEVEEVEKQQQQERGRRNSILSMSSSSSKRSAVSSVLSILSRRSSSASLVSKRFSNATTTTKNSKGSGSIGSSSKKRISSVLKKRRPGSVSRNGSGGGPSGTGPGADEIDEKMTSLMPNFSSRSSLSLSQGGQASSSSSVARLRSQIRLPPTLPLRVQPSTQRPSIDSPVQVNQDGNGLDDNDRVGAVDDVSILPGNLMVQSPVSLPVNADASSSFLPPKSDNSRLSPPNEKPDSSTVAHDIVESPATYNHEEPGDILPYLAEGSTVEGTRSESLQRRSTTTSSGRDHGRSSVFMSMLTLQSSDASNSHTDSPMRRTNSSSNPHANSNRNTRMSMKTARSSLVSKTARSSVMSNAPTPSVSEFPMPPFITMDSDSMPTFDFSRLTMSDRPNSGSGSGGGNTSNSNNNMDVMRSSTGTGSGIGGGNLTGSGTGTFTDLVASTSSSSSGSFRKSIPIRFAGGSGGIGSSAITGVTPPSAYPLAYRAPARPKRNRALGVALLGLDVPASVQSRAPIVRRGSSRSSRGTGSSKSPKRRNKLPIRGDPIPMRAGRVGSGGMENNVSSGGTSSTTFFMPPPPPSSNDHGSQLDLPSRGPSRTTMTSVITSTTDEEFAHGEVQLLVARRENPPGIPDVPTRAVPPGTDDSMSISVDGSRPISGTTSEGKWEIIFPGLPPGMTPILTSEGNGSHRSGGPPLAAVPVSARTDAFERATTVEMSPILSNRIGGSGGGGGAALSRDPSFGAISVGNMRLDATAGLPWSPNFDWPASPTSFTNFSSIRRPSLPYSSSGHLVGNGNVPFSSSGHLIGGDNAPDAAGIPRGEECQDELQNRPNVPFDSLQSLNWKDLIGPRSGSQVDPIDTDRRSNVRQSTYSVASTFFGGGKSQVEESPSPLTPASPSVIPPVPPIPTRFSRSSALVADSPRRTVASLSTNFRPSWNSRAFSPRSPGTPQQQQQQQQMLPSAARPIGNLNDVFATSWNSGSTTTRYSSGPGAGRILVPKATTELDSRSEQGTPVRSFPQRGVPFP
ncbi:hypothetical protein FRC17_011199, partial [Serendipita sp. 399]